MSAEPIGMTIRIDREGASAVIVHVDDNCDMSICGRDAAATFETPDGPVVVNRDGDGIVVVFKRGVVWRSTSLVEEERRREAELQIHHPTRKQVEEALMLLGWFPNSANTPESGTWYSDHGASAQWIIMDCHIDAPAVGKDGGGAMSVDKLRELVVKARSR